MNCMYARTWSTIRALFIAKIVWFIAYMQFKWLDWICPAEDIILIRIRFILDENAMEKSRSVV